ncbi:MAG: HAD-superfamily hydrolase subfamily [Thermoleophilia bacterium]|nr:HAD-superfamily hydrolase subfamily [Thermoleophilia bacterium]
MDTDAPTTPPALPTELAGIDANSLVLLLDVDGVLAPIVDDPAAAAVPAETVALVQRAVDECALVGIVTGRGLERAMEMVPVRGAWYAALHGARIVSPDGVEDVCEVTGGAREHVEVAATLAQTVGWAYEDKGATVTIHFRQRGNLGQRVDPVHVKAQLMTVLNPLKVEVHDAKQVLEVKPKGARTKGDAVRLLSEAAGDAAKAVVFVGDDLTDLDGFRTIDELREGGSQLRFVKVAVGGDEAPAALVEAADVVVPGESAVAPLLRALLDA